MIGAIDRDSAFLPHAFKVTLPFASSRGQGRENAHFIEINQWPDIEPSSPSKARRNRNGCRHHWHISQPGCRFCAMLASPFTG
ncbi:hypothetical protein ATY81_19675 [Rhizobium sp. R72]|nr:hypothetical protein ATY81_19675 [Rhizobium sp. R72]OWW03525.1 hypothetical protein ATY80_19675 [Rhizobium sp. R711]